jgi:hypothetical protein
MDYSEKISTVLPNFAFFPLFPVHVDNSTLIFLNDSLSVNIYSRTLEGGWSFDISVEYNICSVLPYLMTYNGVDTVVFIALSAAAENPSFLVFYTKVNGKWIQQVVLAADLPVTEGPNLGYNSYSFVNEDLIVVGALFDGLTADKRRGDPTVEVGSLLFFQRQSDNTWAVVAKSRSGRIGYFGAGALVSTSHVITSFVDYTQSSFIDPGAFYAVFKCIFEPVNVTCETIEVDSCEFDFTSGAIGYTINSGSECGEVSAKIDDIKLMDYTFTVSYNFTKILAGSVSCDATLKCPAPTVPVAASAPVAPTPSKISAASVASFVGASIAVAVVALL